MNGNEANYMVDNDPVTGVWDLRLQNELCELFYNHTDELFCYDALSCYNESFEE